MHGIRWMAVAVGLAGCGAAPPDTGQFDQGPSAALSQAELSAEPIRFELDLPYGDSGDPRRRLDLYLPDEPASDALPVIVFLHGGGWMQGDKADGAGHLLPFVRDGAYAGVSAGYRLTGEAEWPAQIHDARTVIRWVRAHADEYGLDPGRIAVWGRDAGAHLALMVGVTGDTAALDGEDGPYGEHSSHVSAVVNFFGVTDIPALVGQPSDVDRTGPNAPEARLIGGTVPDNEQRARAASPMSYISAADPPVLTLHGTADRTVPYDQAVRLDRKLNALGVDSYLISVTDAGHGGFPAEADARVAWFLGNVLLGEPVAVPTSPLTD